MKVLKKSISGILIACVLMSMVPFAAFAAEVVSTVNVVMTKPQAGAAPATTAALTETQSADVVSIKWSPAESVFRDNDTYTVTIELGIKPGTDAVFADAKNMSVKMNGNKVRRVETNGKSAVIKFGWILRESNSDKTAAQSTGENTAQSTAQKTETAKTENTKAQNTKSGFSDVRDSDYYSNAVRWAVDKKITTGTTSTTFSPDDTCTRAQILTFLWRAVGSPKYNSFMAFNDVISSDYYFNAATWAKGNDMVSGSVFDPNTPCTRAYTVIYLWKNAGSPKTEISNVFSDVDPNADYAQAVAWAVKNNVTSGTSATTFSPNDTCTRGQIVTFLNRALASASVAAADEKTNQTEQNNNIAETDKTETKDETKPSDTAKTDTTGEDTAKTDTPAKSEGTTGTDSSTNMEELEKVTQTKEKYDTAKYEAAVKKALREALGDSLGSDMTQLQKALLLHDWLVLNCQYDEARKGKYSYSEYGAIVEGMAVCSGYTRAYNDLLSRVGIESEFVYGYIGKASQETAHAWSRVTIDGKKYHVDATGDDPVPDVPGRVKYTYFLVSDAKIKDHIGYKLHCTDTKYDNNQILRGYYAQLIWDSRINKFYYVDIDKVKTSADLSESLKPSGGANGNKPTSVLMTADGKYICFFIPSRYTSEYPMHLYSIETGEYYNYTVKGVKNIIFDRLIQNGSNIEPSRDYWKSGEHMIKADARIPLPKSSQKRTVTFDANYSGGKTASCEYISEYWTKGSGSFDELKRTGYTFGGWYTEKDGGTKVESFDEIKGSDTVLYAHWWSPWKITVEPTLTESGKAARILDGVSDAKEEITIPNLSDTSVWTRTMNVSSTSTSHGKQKYSSEYGEVSVILPLKDPEPFKYGIVYKKSNVYITVEKAGKYTVEYESKENGEVVSSGKMKVTVDEPGESVVVYPRTFTPSGTVTATLYDSDMNVLCSVDYEVN